MNIIKKITFWGLLTLSQFALAQVDFSDLNSSAGCDSTCRSNKTTLRSTAGVRYQMLACPAGYQGYIYQRSLKSRTDIWSNWETIKDDCQCVPTFQNSNQACPENMQGTIESRRDWTCSNVGHWSNWRVVSNTCAYYYIDTQTEYQNISCPANQFGNISQSRTYERWSDGIARNYSAWITSSNTCRGLVGEKTVTSIGRGYYYATVWDHTNAYTPITTPVFLTAVNKWRLQGYRVYESTIRHTITHTSNGIACGVLTISSTSNPLSHGERHDSYVFDNPPPDKCADIMTTIIGNSDIARKYIQPETFESLTGHIVDILQNGGN